jgi:hypothetical protein
LCIRVAKEFGDPRRRDLFLLYKLPFYTSEPYVIFDILGPTLETAKPLIEIRLE